MPKDETRVKMNALLEFIKEFSDDNGYPPSVREICKALDIKSTATAYYYMQLLENDKMIKKTPSKNRAVGVLTPYSGEPKKRCVDIPFVGSIAAGSPILAVENIDGVYSLPEEMFGSGETFMLKVKGSSMIEAGIFDGDFIVVRRQSNADNGQIVAALVEESATVKRFYKENGRYRLKPENSAMKDIIVDEVAVLGVVIGLIRTRV